MFFSLLMVRIGTLPTGLSTSVYNPNLARKGSLVETTSASGRHLADNPENRVRIDGLRGRDPGQANHELAPPPGPLAEDLDAPAVELDEPAHEREPHAEPGLRAIEPAFALNRQVEHVWQ